MQIVFSRSLQRIGIAVPPLKLVEFPDVTGRERKTDLLRPLLCVHPSLQSHVECAPRMSSETPLARTSNRMLGAASFMLVQRAPKSYSHPSTTAPIQDSSDSGHHLHREIHAAWLREQPAYRDPCLQHGHQRLVSAAATRLYSAHRKIGRPLPDARISTTSNPLLPTSSAKSTLSRRRRNDIEPSSQTIRRLSEQRKKQTVSIKCSRDDFCILVLSSCS
jgi:hypothetical protein